MNLNSHILIITLLLVIQSLASTCGNSLLQSGEGCDDGNTNDGDGCDSTCSIEPDYRCNTASPNVCKIDVVISLNKIGINRYTSSNTAVFLFKLDHEFEIFKSINFGSIFTTSITASNRRVEYLSTHNILKVTLDYLYDLQNTVQNFKLQLISTNKFWYDSLTSNLQLHGVNCELTYQQNLWISGVFSYALLGIIIITLAIGFISIFYEKWIGLELLQTYQSVYYMLLLLKQYPFEFSPLYETLKYSNGYNSIFAQDYQRTYTLSNQLNGLSIQKEFILNFNVDLCLIATVAISLIVLAIQRTRLKTRLQSEVNRDINKRIEKINKYFSFVFGQIFIFIVLAFMFRIFNSFTVQLSQQSGSYQVFPDDINQTITIISFLLLFMVIIFIFNWYIMIPDNFTENQEYLSLKFRNMKFIYPIIYLIYQMIFICAISIYYQREYLIQVLLALQICYFFLIIYIWPYNTPRKINRILHNFTILFNQSILILITALTFRWRSVLPGNLQVQSNFEFILYLFFIVGFLICSMILTVARLYIFNRDVQCFSKVDQENNYEELSMLKNATADEQKKNDNTIKSIQQSPFKKNLVSQTLMSPQEQNDRGKLQKNSIHFLNERYLNWKKQNQQQMKPNRFHKIRKTNSKLAELIKTPLEEIIQLRQKQKAQVESNE